jgi:hypothetical protein
MSLSNAERQARWQAKHKKEFERLRRAAERATAEPSSDSKELIAARKEIDRLRARVAELEKPEQVPEGAATAEEWAAAKRAATEALRTRREMSKPQPAKKQPEPARKPKKPLTDEQKAERAATRQRNAAVKEVYLSNEKRLNAKLAKINAFASDTRGDANMRAVAVEKAAGLEDTVNKKYGLPKTREEFEARRKMK